MDDVGATENVTEEYKSFKKRGFLFGCYACVKRVLDFISAFLLFVLLSPFILIILLIKWLEDFSNPIYVSKRVGKDGKIFKIYKIRTMRPDAEEMKQKLIENRKKLTEASYRKA